MSKVPENTIDPMEYIPYKLPRDPRKKNERGVAYMSVLISCGCLYPTRRLL